MLQPNERLLIVIPNIKLFSVCFMLFYYTKEGKTSLSGEKSHYLRMYSKKVLNLCGELDRVNNLVIARQCIKSTIKEKSFFLIHTSR